MIDEKELDHIALSFIHGGFDPFSKAGGCSCPLCTDLRYRIRVIAEKEYNEYRRSVSS